MCTSCVEHELDRLAVLEGVEQLDPGAVDAGAVLQAQRTVDRPAAVPPVAADDLSRERLTEPFERTVDDAQVVQQAAEEALAERADDVLRAGADRLLDLFCLLPAGRLDQLERHVGAADDLARLEVGGELRIVDDHADIAQVGGRIGKCIEHRLDRRVVALHRAHLDDLARRGRAPR